MSLTTLPGLVFAGRHFSAADLQLIAEVTKDSSALALTELSKTLAELLEWKRPTGGLKYEECRALLEHLQAEGLVALPALRHTSPRGPRQIRATPEGDPQDLLTGTLADYLPLSLQLVRGADASAPQTAAGGCTPQTAPGSSTSSLFNQLIDRYHYLGYRVPFGAHLRYLVGSEQLPGRYLACLLFSSPAWKMAPRDAWIGWSSEQRRRNLQYIVCQSRFLVLPWAHLPHLASKILALSARQLPADWQKLYGYRPLLLETLVDSSRFSGTCYKAANWIHLGMTSGRGRMDRQHLAHGRAVKDIYVLPLARNCRQKLCETSPPSFMDSDVDMPVR